MLAYAGMWGLAYDYTVKVWNDSDKLFTKAEKRGEEVEHDVMVRFEGLQKQALEEYKSLRKNLWTRVGDVREEVVEAAEKLQDEVKERVEKLQDEVQTRFSGGKEMVSEVIQQISIAKPETVTETVEQAVKSAEVRVEKAVKSAKKSAGEATKQVKSAAAKMVEMPFEGYDNTIWKDVISKVQGLEDVEQLNLVRAYEAATKKRPSILREVDARLAALATKVEEKVEEVVEG
jgi:hypothetical protein